MAQKDRFTKIKGTKDFLVLTVACTFICLWAIRDAWFPTEKILKKHPLEFPVTVSVSGVVHTIPVGVGDEVRGEIPLLTLYSQSYKDALTVAEAAYKAAVETQEKDDIKDKLEELVEAKDNLRHTTVSCNDFTLETTHGSSTLHGKVLEIMMEPATKVEAGETVMLIEPADTFYMFNKTLAVLAFIGAIVGLFFHRIASR